MSEGPAELHVLVVDDSAVVRQVMTAILTREPGFTVTVAADPIIAMEKMKRQRPDVIILDLQLPRMDGITFLVKQMDEDPLPVVVCSSAAQKGTAVAIRALEAGAVEIVAKPVVGVREFLEESAVLLVDAVRAAAQARFRRHRPIEAVQSPVVSVKPRPLACSPTVIAVGASTGGTEALRQLLEGLPPDTPGMVIVQHMPERFTAAFASRLNETCPLLVKEAEDGEDVTAGKALIAPGNRHLLLTRAGAGFRVLVTQGELVSRHRPSVDSLFRSVAQAARANAVGLIMTGMGNDGADGLLAMRRAGARTFAQDEESSVVFGMPKEAIALGAVETVLPLDRLGVAILAAARSNLARGAQS